MSKASTTFESNSLARKNLLYRLKKSEWTLKSLSGELGRNETYLSQYIQRGTPKILPEDVRSTLARLLGGSSHDYQDNGRPNAPRKSLREDVAAFTPALNIAKEARDLGLDPEAIAAKAVEDAVKRKRIEAWNEENRDAIESWNAHYRKHGLWNEKYRQF